MANTRDVLGDQATLDALVSDTLTSFVDDEIDSLCEYAFKNRTALESIMLGNLGRVSNHAFADSGITHIYEDTFPVLTTLGQYAFESCNKLKSAVFSSNTKGMYGNNFYSCSNVEKIEFKSSTMTIANSQNFGYCRKLKELILWSDTVPSISNTQAFPGCDFVDGCGAVYVPDGLVSSYKAHAQWGAMNIVPISSYPLTSWGTITDTWEEIQAAQEDGSYLSKYSIGDTKDITIDGEPYLAEIVGFDLDEAEDSDVSANITWILRYVTEEVPMNNTSPSTAAGGWESSDLRSHLINDVLPTINIKNYIVPVVKTFKDISTSSTRTVTDSLWIPSRREIENATAYETSGCAYSERFTNDTSRKKASSWWLRTAVSSSSFYCITTTGAISSSPAGNKYGVAIGFCTGSESETIADDWSAIAASAANGTYKTKYSIGDTKSIDLGTEGKHFMQLVAFDADDKADGTGKAPMTWIMKDLLPTTHRMNPIKVDGQEGTGTLGGYDKTEMKSYLTETILPLFPADIRNNIVPVTKHQKAYDASETTFQESTTETLWIPGNKEIFSSTSYDTGGPAYSDVFKDVTSRTKKRNGSAYRWWLRTANSAASFRIVNSSGSDYVSSAYDSYGVCPGFCF